MAWCSGFALIQQHRVDVAFEVVDGDERKLVGEGQRLSVGDADQQSSGEAGAGGDGDGIEIGERDAGLFESCADDGNDGAHAVSSTACPLS